MTHHQASQADQLKWPVVLYTLSFAGMGVAIASVAWVSGDILLSGLLIVLAGLGHVLSGLGKGRRLKLGLAIYPALGISAWFLRDDLIGIASGGSLFPLAILLSLVLALISFNLRTLRTLYDAWLLSLVVILLAGVGALSTQFGLFLLAFGIVAVIFLIASHMADLARRLQFMTLGGPLYLAFPVGIVMLLVLGASLAIFLLLPQNLGIQKVSPLPSRLDLTMQQPLPPQHSPTGGEAPADGILPSRSLETPSPSSPDSQNTRLKAAAQSARPIPGNGQLAEQFGVPGQSTDQPPLPINSSRLAAGKVQYTPLGYTGENGRDVVMHVRSPLASYWRGRVLDEYDGRGWYASGLRTRLHQNDGGMLYFDDTPRRVGDNSVYVQTFFLSIAQPNAVFTGYSPGVVNPKDLLDKGDVRRANAINIDALYEPGSYRVISAVPGITPQDLEFDSADTNILYGTTQMSVPARVQELARSIISGATSDYEKAARLERYLLGNYGYDLTVPPLSRSGDVVESFLFERQVGYCAQFATAMAVMAQAVGLPARVATGYLPGKYNSLSGVHVVRLQDAHAWVEIKFKKNGWVPFDPTPRPDSPWDSYTGITKAPTTLQQVIRADLKGAVSGVPSLALGGFSSLFGDGSKLPKAATGLLLVIVAFLVGRALITRTRKTGVRTTLWGYTALLDPGRDEMRSVYRKAVRRLEQRGYPRRQTNQSPEDYIGEIQKAGLPVPEPFREISRRAKDAFYNPSPFDSSVAKDMNSRLQVLRRARGLGRDVTGS